MIKIILFGMIVIIGESYKLYERVIVKYSCPLICNINHIHEYKVGVKTLTDGLKTCSKCGIPHTLESFQKIKNTYLSWCKDCRTAKEKEKWAAKKMFGG